MYTLTSQIFYVKIYSSSQGLPTKWHCLIWHCSQIKHKNWTTENRNFSDLRVHFILILCNLSLKPSISDRTPDRADKITTLVIVYKYGLADRPDILNGLSSSCNMLNPNLEPIISATGRLEWEQMPHTELQQRHFCCKLTSLFKERIFVGFLYYFCQKSYVEVILATNKLVKWYRNC